MYEGVEVHAVGKAGGVGGEPSAERGVVVTAAIVNEACGIGPFGGKTPGAELGAEFFAKGAILGDFDFSAM